jgi:hypothetical protein
MLCVCVSDFLPESEPIRATYEQSFSRETKVPVSLIGTPAIAYNNLPLRSTDDLLVAGGRIDDSGNFVIIGGVHRIAFDLTMPAINGYRAQMLRPKFSDDLSEIEVTFRMKRLAGSDF